MATSTLPPAYDYFLDFIVAKATPPEILAFELPSDVRQRAIELLDKQDEDSLTSDEAAELEQMRQIELLMMALKARAIESSESK